MLDCVSHMPLMRNGLHYIAFMIFEVSPNQITELDSTELVKLLKKLLYAEAQKTGVSMRGVSVPLQINVSDGGEDARISWKAGRQETDYLPSRFCIFQSKATDPEPAGWKKEVWTKSSQKKGAQRQLNDALIKCIQEGGSYVGFTSAVLIGHKLDRRIDAIKKGIQEAGADPDNIKAIDIYDANKISQWVSQHPAVAIWLNEKQSGLALRDFKTISQLGEKPDISLIPKIEDKTSRFRLNTHNQSTGSENNQLKPLTFEQAEEYLLNHIADSQKFARIIGSSGIGKTRFVYEILRGGKTIAGIVLSASIVYCEGQRIQNEVIHLVRSLSSSKSSALLVIDDCSRELAAKLYEIATTRESQLRVITIGNDSQPIETTGRNCLNISIDIADNELIDGIIRSRYPNIDSSVTQLIRELSGGYPRIAVLATDNYSDQLPILKSVEDLVERILIGCGIKEPSHLRAVECLSLFTQLGADEKFSGEIDLVASSLARQTGDEMYEYLARKSNQNLISHYGDHFTMQPLPIAIFLGRRRLDLLRINTILSFIENAPPSLRNSFLSRWCYFECSRTAVSVAQRLLRADSFCGSVAGLKTDIGSQCLMAIVHIDPDSVMSQLEYLFGNLELEELEEFVKCRELIQVLVKLASRKNSFHYAATLLMKLAAISNETCSRLANNRFQQLYQLYYNGTEAEPSYKFFTLRKGISSGDTRLISVCLKALEKALNQSFFSGSPVFGQIGIQRPLREWNPKTYGEAWEYNKEGLLALLDIHTKYPSLRADCEKVIIGSLRDLICEYLFDDIEKALHTIAKTKESWPEAIEKLGDWLYFDRQKSSVTLAKKVRNLYANLMPSDPIQKALLYTKFAGLTFHDPDQDYSLEQAASLSKEYSVKKAEEIAEEISKDDNLVYRAIEAMAKEELQGVTAFTQKISEKLKDPVEAFRIAVNSFEKSEGQKGIRFVCGLLAGIDKVSPTNSTQCIHIASESDALKSQMVNVYAAVKLSPDRVKAIAISLAKGDIRAADCVHFSYGRRLSSLNFEDVLPLLEELISGQGTDGIRSALDIIYMYQDDQTTIDPALFQLTKQIVTSPKLIQCFIDSDTGYHHVDTGYLLEKLVLAIQEESSLETDFSEKLIGQIVCICEAEKFSSFSASEHNFRGIVQLLAVSEPMLLWEAVSNLLEFGTLTAVNRIERLIKSVEGSAESENDQLSILFRLPEATFIRWAEASPHVRVPLLLKFYPLLKDNPKGCQWHPKLGSLTHKFGSISEFRQALADRIYPRSWSGSIIPHFEKCLRLIDEWFDHPVPEMSEWAMEMHFSIERRIDWHQKRESNSGG